MKVFVALVAICFFAVYAKGQIAASNPGEEQELKKLAKSLKEDHLTQDVIDDLDKAEDFVRNVDVGKLEQLREIINIKIDEAVHKLESMDRDDIPVYIINGLKNLRDAFVSDKNYEHLKKFLEDSSMAALKDDMDQYKSMSDEELHDTIEKEAQQLKDYFNTGFDEIENKPGEVIDALENLKRTILSYMQD
ncbi:hypothetical protein PoB_007355300 [Plakobranchus ocellatus]|uniref:Uncharacterized protein n=1 Tax=Plakobranchus ocellatus TaxID=259542 RepID=A0AAV4DSI8_9GAST|nr:hypothetical protein PoB_007355300 [Plakobranchus ocellatus]